MACGKRDLRRTFLQRRRDSTAQVRLADDVARNRLLAGRLAAPPATVAAYVSGPGEPGTEGLIDALHAAGVRVLLPVLHRDPDWALYGGPGTLRPGRWGILQPAGEPLGAAALARAGVVIVPGLAGSAGGVRLGRGGGWYDRALLRASPGTPVWLLLNDDEVVAELPSEPHDIAVTAIVTPTRWLDCSAR